MRGGFFFSIEKGKGRGSSLLTTMMPKTLRWPLTSPIWARHQAMKKKPRTARMEKMTTYRTSVLVFTL